MRRHCALLLSTTVTLATAGVTRLEAQTGLTPAHATAIGDSVRQTLTSFQGAMARGRWDSVGAYYADRPDFRWVEEGMVVARSAEDIRKYLRGMKASMRIVTRYDSTETMALAPGLAMVLTRFSTTMGDSGSAGFTFGGELTMTLIHQGNRWVILNGHSSAPHPH